LLKCESQIKFLHVTCVSSSSAEVMTQKYESGIDNRVPDKRSFQRIESVALYQLWSNVRFRIGNPMERAAMWLSSRNLATSICFGHIQDVHGIF